MTPDDPVVRRTVEIENLTMCLDRRGDSGQIEFYEEPILYRCGISVRIISTFSSANQRTPDQVKISVQTDRLGLCVSETQLPMLVRLIQERFYFFNTVFGPYRGFFFNFFTGVPKIREAGLKNIFYDPSIELYLGAIVTSVSLEESRCPFF